jgi:hypothetical protein
MSEFVVIAVKDGSPILVNLDQVTCVDEIGPDHVSVWLGANHKLEFKGESGSEVGAFFLHRIGNTLLSDFGLNGMLGRVRTKPVTN